MELDTLVVLQCLFAGYPLMLIILLILFRSYSYFLFLNSVDSLNHLERVSEY